MSSLTTLNIARLFSLAAPRAQLSSAADGCRHRCHARDYGDNFASPVLRDDVFATQFHPEKNQKIGLQLLWNFADIAQA